MTLRELAAMAAGRQKVQWQHTSSVLAFLAEPHRDRKKRSRPFTPADFDPTRPRKRLGKGRPISVSQFVDDLMEPIEGKQAHGKR